MATYFKAHRFQTIAMVCVLLCGCRNATWKTSAGYLKSPRSHADRMYSSPNSSNPSAFDDANASELLPPDPYEAMGQPYNGDRSTSPSFAPNPKSPSSLKESEVPAPPAPSDPPVPTTKKQRWNLIPSGFKRPSSTKYVPEDQSSQSKVDRRWPGKLAKSNVTDAHEFKSDSPQETVLSREQFSTRSRSLQDFNADSIPENPPLPSPVASESMEAAPAASSNRSNAASRYQANNYFKNTPRSFRPGPSLDSVPRPVNVPEPSESLNDGSTADMPLLLPPGN